MVLPLEGNRRTELRMNYFKLPSRWRRKSPPTRVNLCARPFAISSANCFTCFLLMSRTLTSLLIPPPIGVWLSYHCDTVVFSIEIERPGTAFTAPGLILLFETSCGFYRLMRQGWGILSRRTQTLGDVSGHRAYLSLDFSEVDGCPGPS